MYKQAQIALGLCLLCLSLQTIAGEDPGLVAVEQAKQNGKFLIAFFADAKTDVAKTNALKVSVEKAAAALSDQTDAVYIDMGEEAQQGLVKQFRLRYAPRPITLILAPNGAIVGSFQVPFTPEQLKQGLPSPCLLQCLQALQQGKLVMICVQNKESLGNVEAMKSANDFLSDPRFKDYTAKVVIDPDAAAEANVLKQLQIVEGTKQATSLLLAPPGTVVGKWEGAVSKETIVQQLSLAMSRGGGCGGGACIDPNCETPAQGGAQ